MLTIVCPNCGPRPVEEFRFGGELPEPPADLTGEFDRDLAAAVHLDAVDVGLGVFDLGATATRAGGLGGGHRDGGLRAARRLDP